MSGCKNKFLARLYDGVSRRILSARKKNLVFSNNHFKVLMFHDISDCGEYSATFNDFCKIIDELLTRGYEFVDVTKLIECKNIKSLDRKVLITFDDGFESTFSMARPFLESMGIPFCVFVTASFVGKTGYLNSEQLKLLSENPFCTIGSHFVNHIMSRFADKETIVKEVNDSFDYLQKHCVIKDRIIALPYGSKYSCSSKDLKIISRLNVSCIFTTNQSYVWKIKPFSVPRIDASNILKNEIINK